MTREYYADLLQDFNIMFVHLDKIQRKEKEYLVQTSLEDWINKTPNWDVIVTE